MIRTDSEYRHAVRRAQEDKVIIAQQRAGFEVQGFNPAEVETLLQPTLSFHAQLTDEITWYENVCNGNILPVMRIGDMGRMLIASRIARKITQKELAQRLGVSESTVSRDENNDYHGITIERTQRILDALHVAVEAKIILMSEANTEYSVSAPYETDADPCPPVEAPAADLHLV